MSKHFYERTVHDRIGTTRGPVVNPDAKSPYQRYGKREFQYSPGYYAWHRRMTGKGKAAQVEAR